MSKGFLPVIKPVGPTSFDIVAKARRALSEKRMGHCGTLDPDARGLLVLAAGFCTRLIEFLPLEPKVYRFIMRLGSETDTGDAVGTVTSTTEIIPTENQIREILPLFTGKIMQRPPAFSAIKIDGQRAYDLARAGKEVSIAERETTIHGLSLFSFDIDKREAFLEASVSSGTYIRSLAVDMARALGSLAHATDIDRISTGMFSAKTALPFDQLQSEGLANLLSAETVIRSSGLQCVDVDDSTAQKIRYGQRFESDSGSEKIFAFDKDGKFLAVAQKCGECVYHAGKVFGVEQ